MRKPMCYFLIYRVLYGQQPDLQHPTGGIVYQPEAYYWGLPVVDYHVIEDLVGQRYHAGPNEQLYVQEAVDKEDINKAEMLHNQWEVDMHEFYELMEVSDE